jgi:hypothetical protein
MQSRFVIVLACILGVVLSDSTALARSPRAKRTAHEAASTPPFPWAAVAETVGPILGIWLGTLLLRRTLDRDKPSRPLVDGEIASLPVAWFSVMTGFFEKKATERKTEPPQTTSVPDSQPVTSDLWSRAPDLQEWTPPRSSDDSDL